MSDVRVARAALVASLCLLLVTGAGCSVKLRAVQLKVDVNDDAMKLIKPESGRYAGGEVVITIVNNTAAKRQFTLVRTDASPQNLPAHVLAAFSDRDDSRVVAVTGVMRAAKIGLIFGALPQPEPTEVKLHVYLHTNTPYLLFDRLGGFRHGIALRIEATKS